MDALILGMDRALRAITGTSRGTGRSYPAQELRADELDERQVRDAAALIRVNHAGEIAAQALYHGQSLTARTAAVRQALDRAAIEEEDHLLWCRRRLKELDSAPSLLDPLWYMGSFAIGATAGLVGDRVSLGFLAETERQVEAHLADHLERLPEGDQRSRALVTQMKMDEAQHAQAAEAHGAASLPSVVKHLMKSVSKIMTHAAARI